MFQRIADVAGLMHRTSIVAYPWFSPAGQQSGVINNAIQTCSTIQIKHKEIVSILQESTPLINHHTWFRNTPVW